MLVPARALAARVPVLVAGDRNAEFLNMKWFRVTAQPESRSKPEHQAGIHHYLRQHGENKKRIHLRIEEDGNAVMLVNASRIYHFNPSAALMASLTLEEKNEAEAIRTITRAFAVGKSQAAQDYQAFLENFLPLIDPGSEACPICDFKYRNEHAFFQQTISPIPHGFSDDIPMQ